MRGVWIASLVLASASACSDFRLRSVDDAIVVSARTMDFEFDLQSTLEVVPRATLIQEPVAKDCPECPDYGWRTKYGFVGVNMLGLNVATDGLNEAGLSAAWLYLVGTEYAQPNVSDPRPIVTSLVTYVLGNYATVDDVKAGLATIQVAEPLPSIAKLMGHDSGLDSLPLHLAVHDAAGHNLVVEFLNGTMHVHDNPGGVMTNAPPLPEHLAAFAAAGMDAPLPGGYDSNARFLRLALLNHHSTVPYLANTSYNTSTPEQAAVSAALHLIDTVTIPEAAQHNGGATQFSLVRDHTQRKLYVKATQNQVLRVVDVGQIDFGVATNRKAKPVTLGAWFVNVTQDVLDTGRPSHDMPPRSVVQAALLRTTAPMALFEASHATPNVFVFASGAVAGMVVMAVASVVGRRAGYAAIA